MVLDHEGSIWLILFVRAVHEDRAARYGDTEYLGQDDYGLIKAGRYSRFGILGTRHRVIHCVLDQAAGTG
jgi:hypothetical protein